MACAIPFQSLAATIMPCGAGSLANYIASSGCTVGDQYFYNFESLTSTGTSSISPSSITVTPITTATMPGFQFTLNQSALTNQIVDNPFAFDVMEAPNASNYIAGATLTQTGGMATNDGGVAGTASLCLGGAITPTGGCSATPAGRSLGTYALSGGLTQTSDTLTTLTPHNLVGITADFSSDGGTAGTASVTSFAIQVNTTTIPEPATFGLCAFALFAAFAGSRKFKNQVVRQ